MTLEEVLPLYNKKKRAWLTELVGAGIITPDEHGFPAGGKQYYMQSLGEASKEKSMNEETFIKKLNPGLTYLLKDGSLFMKMRTGNFCLGNRLIENWAKGPKKIAWNPLKEMWEVAR